MFTSVLSLLVAAIFTSQSDAASTPRSPVPAPWPLTPLTESPHVLALSRRNPESDLQPRSASSRHRRRSTIPVSSQNAPLTALYAGAEYVTEITFGTETFLVVVDTGSSNTWLVETGFKCYTYTRPYTPLPESGCLFGPTYNITHTFSQTHDENLNFTYDSGEFITGIIGTEDVTLGGIKVEKQTVGVVQSAGWFGDGFTSGLLGLAYPDFTSAYKGTDPSKDSPATQVVYDPIFTTMYKKGLISSNLFSLAIERDVSGPAGYLSFGGLPPVTISNDFTSTPILITDIPSQGVPKAYIWYTINIDNVLLHRDPLPSSGGTEYQYIIDSGTSYFIMPTSIANAINSAFVPPPVYSDTLSLWILPCDAHSPSLSIEINGVAFDINPLDMILSTDTTDANGKDICSTTIIDGGSGSDNAYVLGDPFLKNVVAVFDVGAGMMRFASREHYVSNDPYKM